MGSNRLLAWTGLLVLTTAALLHNLPRLAPGMYDWAEPGNVAAALVQGRGFSDPFDGGTGATAWVSPAPVLVEAAVFTAFGVKTPASASVLLALSVLGLAAANALLVAALRPHGRLLAAAASAWFLAFASLLPGGPLTVLSEAWLDILLSAALLWAALGAARDPGHPNTPAIVLVCFLAPLENAGLAVASAGVVAALAWTRRSKPRGLVLPALAALAALLAVGIWTARNMAALGRPVPLKSNSWFELHLANVDSADGLPRMETVLRRLPYFDVREFSRYKAMGEMAYVDSFRGPALTALRSDPLHFAANIGRRLGAALVFSRREGGGQSTRFPFQPGDAALLSASGELITMGPSLGLWARIDTPPAEERARLRSLGLRDEGAIWIDWLSSRLAFDQEYRGPLGIALSFLSAGIPVMALLLSAVVLSGNLLRPAAWAALVAAGMLLPYVLVNHNERHQLPLIAMQAVFVGALFQAALSRARGATVP